MKKILLLFTLFLGFYAVSQTQTAEKYFDRGNEKLFPKAGLKADYQGAIADYTQAITIKPNYAEAFFNRGIAKDEIGDYQGAIADYTQAIKIDPNNAVAYYNRGNVKCCLMLQDFQGAITDFTKAISLEPNDAETYNRRAFAKENRQDYQGAIADYTKAISLEPNDAEAYRNRAYSKEKLKDYQGAIADYTKVIALDSNNDEAYNNRGDAKAELEDYQGAIADFTQAIALDSSNADAYHGRGNAKQSLEDYQGAIADFTNTSWANDERGYAKYLSQDYQGAIADYTKAISFYPNRALLYFCRGLAKGKIEDIAGAIVDYSLAIRICPKFAMAYNNKAYCLIQLGRYEEALPLVNKALRLEKQNGFILDYREAFYLFGEPVRQLKKQYELILDTRDKYWFRKGVLRLKKQYELILDTRGEAYYWLGKYNECIQDMDKAIALQTEEHLADNSYYIRGLAKLKLNKDTDGNEDLKKACQLGKKEACQLAKIPAVDINIPKKEACLSEVDINIPVTKVNNDKTFVLIIANEAYKRVATVPFARNDGKVFKEYCVKTFNIPEKNITFVEDATLNDMTYAIDILSQTLEAYKGEAKAIVYYSGHGIPDEANGNAYILPIDGYATNTSTAYSLQTLYDLLGKINTQSITYFIDACFSGTNREGGMLVAARGVAREAKKGMLSGNSVLFSAATGDQTAYPYKEQGHGLFTYFLLKKLQETEGNVSYSELKDYITTQISRESLRVNKKLQTPTIVVAPNVSQQWMNWKLTK